MKILTQTLVAAAFIFAFSLAFTSSASAATTTATTKLIWRVNEALMAAKLPVTTAAQQSFAAGVASGHYTSYTQLVDAMKWHKAHGRWMANTSAFMMKAKPMIWAVEGTVAEVNANRIEVWGTDKWGNQVTWKFKITENTKVKDGVLLIDVSEQTRAEVTNELERGSMVKVWYSSSWEAVVIQNLDMPVS